MLCPTCLGANMADQGQYYQCPRCGDIQTKCRQDRGVQKFHKACLQRREPTTQQRVKQFINFISHPNHHSNTTIHHGVPGYILPDGRSLGMVNRDGGRIPYIDFKIPEGWEVVSRKNGITLIRRVKNGK